jgi:hypothetical protein
MKSRWSLSAIVALTVLTAGCDDDTSADGSDTMVATDGGTSTGDSEGSMPDLGDDWEHRCTVPQGHSGRPNTIAEAVAHIQALPPPVDIPCVLQSFARPLPVLASSSVFSAQPGRGDRSPRLFVFFDGLILSFATEGHGSHLLEFAEFIGPTTTVKAELEFPLDPTTLEVEDAFTRVQDEDRGTVCRLCHRNEEPAPEALYPGAFASDALAPEIRTILELGEVRVYADACDPTEDAHRCDVYDALFLAGDVVPGEFAPEIQTIFDYEDD